MGNSVLTVSGFFKQGATDTAADKMMKVLEADCLLYTSRDKKPSIRKALAAAKDKAKQLNAARDKVKKIDRGREI